MRQREAKPPKTTGAEAPYRPTVEVVELDIRRFLTAVNDEPDVPVQEMALMEDIEAVLNDELIASLEAVLEDAIYGPDQDNPDRLNAYYTTQHLLKKLRLLQKCRLRDAVQVKLRASKS